MNICLDSLLIMRSAIELVLPVVLLNFSMECSLLCSSVLQSSSFYLPINFSLNGSVGLKKDTITLGKFVTNKIWHLSLYIKLSWYHATSSLSRHFSVNKVICKFFCKFTEQYQLVKVLWRSWKYNILKRETNC